MMFEKWQRAWADRLQSICSARRWPRTSTAPIAASSFSWTTASGVAARLSIARGSKEQKCIRTRVDRRQSPVGGRLPREPARLRPAGAARQRHPRGRALCTTTASCQVRLTGDGSHGSGLGLVPLRRAGEHFKQARSIPL